MLQELGIVGGSIKDSEQSSMYIGTLVHVPECHHSTHASTEQTECSCRVAAPNQALMQQHDYLQRSAYKKLSYGAMSR